LALSPRRSSVSPSSTEHGGHLETITMGALGFEVMLGALTTTGSLLAFAKLQGLVRGTPMTYKGQNIFNMALLAVTIGIFCLPDRCARLDAAVLSRWLGWHSSSDCCW
jgi:NAD/NADP transhydrogenase beta subunit